MSPSRRAKYPLAGRWKMRTVIDRWNERDLANNPVSCARLDCGHLRASPYIGFWKGKRTRCYDCGEKTR